MSHGSGDPLNARRLLDTSAEFNPEAAASVVLARIRKLLNGYEPGMPVEHAALPAALAATLTDPALERERTFVLGWLHWLNDDPAAAEPLLAEAMRRAHEENAAEARAEAAYWLARVRLLLGRAEALAEFESMLRGLAGSPQATAWFVDLLWRAGRVDRAEQVWKSVRGNRRVAGCAEGPLLEARMLLRRGETTPAERLLNDTTPVNGVVFVERLLLLAWIASHQKQHDKALALLAQTREGPYPATALQVWTDTIERRARGEWSEGAGRPPVVLRDFLAGQQARREGQSDRAIAAYRAALGSPAAQPFARYALACLGQDDAAALLASQPGLFLAVRCRARLALERFRQREASPVEYLDALQQAAAIGYQVGGAEHFRRLATALQQRQPDPAALRELITNQETGAATRNAVRVALELAVRRLPLADARQLLLEWSKRDELDGELRSLIGKQLQRLLLLEGEADEASVGRQPHDEDNHGADAPRSPAMRLCQAAQIIGPPSADMERWRDEVRELRSATRWKGLAQALLLQEAAQRGDVAAVLALLEEVDAWRGLHALPRFVLRTLESTVAAQPNHPGWRRGLSRWLQLWDLAALGTAGATLAVHAGLTTPQGDTAEPPSGTPVVPWLLHQAARALGRDDAIEALAFTRRALALDPDHASLARDALPEMEQRARAQCLAAAVQPAGENAPLAAGLLVDAVDALAEVPDGAAVLDGLRSGDLAAIRARLDALSERPDLLPRLAHHLALLMHRTAQALEEQEQTASAEPYWRRAWQCWLRFFGATEAAPDAETRRLVLGWLLALHRRRINDLLARNAIDPARRHWDLVRELPALASRAEETLGRDLAKRIERFHEELATEYLLTTREAMRYGVIPEGWRADYEKGLGYLRRLLSLDHDNPRLLTAVVEICDDWFLDLYHLGDPPGLRARIERFTPFAQQLARRIDDRPGDLSARAALADFWKFRGFITGDHERKAALYREALRFNPANSNVRDLLAELERSNDPPPP